LTFAPKGLSVVIVPSLLIRSILPRGFVSKWGKACIEMFHELCTQRLAWQTAANRAGRLSRRQSRKFAPSSNHENRPEAVLHSFRRMAGKSRKRPAVETARNSRFGRYPPERREAFIQSASKRKPAEELDARASGAHNLVKEILTNLLDVLRMSLRTLNPAVKDLVSSGRERFACEKTRPLFRPLKQN
jgi:hypothetical protein